jgi:uncharacterized protein YjbI with pentapeptide repeats
MKGFEMSWDWTGFRGKTLWDWLQLLIVPAILAVGGLVITQTQDKIQKRRQADSDAAAALRQQASDESAAVQSYLDRMGQLLLEKDLLISQMQDPVRELARARTITLLSNLSGDRKRMVVSFLLEAGLIFRPRRALSGVQGNHPIVSLASADLTNAQLQNLVLENANLQHANLQGAQLVGAGLGGFVNRAGVYEDVADLSGADLQEADLSDANLEGTLLTGANLKDADLTRGNLEGADLRVLTVRMGIESRQIPADLTRANLTGAYLMDADLSGANLTEAVLSNVDLTRAKVDEEQLSAAYSLTNAVMPDGTLYDGRFKLPADQEEN